MSHMFDLRNAEGETVWAGDSRKDLAKLDLPEGDYQLWKFAGTVPVRVVPTRKRVVFQSATKKGPRKPRSATAIGDSVPGEAIA